MTTRAPVKRMSDHDLEMTRREWNLVRTSPAAEAWAATIRLVLEHLVAEREYTKELEAKLEAVRRSAADIDRR